MGHDDPLADSLQLDLAMKGLKRIKPRTADPRLPITPLILQSMFEVLSHHAHSYNNILLWAASCLGFFGFLRSGEFTVSSLEEFDHRRHLTPMDVSVDDHNNPHLMGVRLKYSKTDQLGEGLTIYMGRTGSNICPVSAMTSYLQLRGLSCGPLFRLQDGTPLSRSLLVTWLKQTLAAAGIDSSRFSGHSYRIGVATTAASKGVGDATIQTLGRWRSESYKRYIRVPRQELGSISRTLVSNISS